MKTAVVPGANARWEVRDVPTPEPGPNEVLIRVRASGLCFTDVHITHGAIPTQFPRTLGHEPVGDVAAVGPGVTSRKVGDRVGVAWLQYSCLRCEWCLRGKPMFCPGQVGTGVQTPGGHAEYMAARADATALIPDGVGYDQAAPIFCAGYTVWSGLRRADPKPHERVAVLGVGGLGHLAVQYSKAAGFATFALSHSPDKERMIRDLGADEVCADGKALAAAGGADVLLMTANSYKPVAAALEGMRPDGRIVVMGLADEPLQIPGEALIMKRLSVLGSQQNGPEFLYEALDFVARGKVKVMAETYPLDRVNEAYDRVASGDVRFRAVLTTGA